MSYAAIGAPGDRTPICPHGPRMDFAFPLPALLSEVGEHSKHLITAGAGGCSKAKLQPGEDTATLCENIPGARQARRQQGMILSHLTHSITSPGPVEQG